MDNFVYVGKMNRVVAVLIYNGKLYEDSNHQYALETAFKDAGKSLNIDLNEEMILIGVNKNV